MWTFTRNSSDVTLFGYAVYGNSPRWIRKLHRILLRMDDIIYWLAYRIHPRYRYHIVKTGLTPGYYDVDEILFRACFALLGRFVEEELGTEEWRFERGEGEPPYLSEMYKGYRLHSSDGRDEKAIDLWLWYKHELPALEKSYDEELLAAHEEKRESRYPFDYVEEVKSEKLNDLMTLRRCLWT